MLDLNRTDPDLLSIVDDVVAELLARSTLLAADEVMVVGARCRDIFQSALGHSFPLRATTDIDLGLAVRNWTAYDELTDVLPTAGNTGIRFQVANTVADLMPFGPVETFAYETGHGQDLLVQEELDSAAVASRRLGEEIGEVVGRERLPELAERWARTPKDLLYHHMTVMNAPGWPGSAERRRELVQAMERGLEI